MLVTPGADTPPDLADALYYIQEMATPDAMDELLDRIPLEKLRGKFLRFNAADVAVRAWLTDPNMLERTHAEMSATQPRRFQYFPPYHGKPVATFNHPTPECLGRLDHSLNESFRPKNRGGVQVFAFPHSQDCMFLIRHGEPFRREGTLNGDETSSVLYRRVKFDVAVYDYRTGTLRVHAQAKWETNAYRNFFGMHLFGDFAHFPDIGRYSLEPLRSGVACLECQYVDQIKRVELTSVHVHHGGKYNAVEVQKASNVFAAIKSRGRELPQRVKLIRAAFAIHFRGRRNQPARTLVLKPPNIAQYGRDEDSLIVDRWLTLRGFISQPFPETHEEVGPLLAGN